MTTKTLFVRILPKSGPEKFFRCGMEFSSGWKKKEVDNATAERLESEQMLEVTEKEPEGYEPEATTNGPTVAEKIRDALVEAHASKTTPLPSGKKR